MLVQPAKNRVCPSKRVTQFKIDFLAHKSINLRYVGLFQKRTGPVFAKTDGSLVVSLLSNLVFCELGEKENC